ncbi:uncharacterized protein LOC135464467 [Liolophura sinensis]|uniref:uncharacterized protein LOC135464467 n=1 Tax=Liolophura sinensis TaxID=3198878 RepID=UPI0031597D2E
MKEHTMFNHLQTLEAAIAHAVEYETVKGLNKPVYKPQFYTQTGVGYVRVVRTADALMVGSVAEQLQEHITQSEVPLIGYIVGEVEPGEVQYFIAEGGLSSDGKKAFRSFFSRLGYLRTKFPEVPVMCLTATSSKATLLTVRQLLALIKPFEYLESPERPNIRLCVKKIKTGHEAVQWLVEGIRRYGNTYPKTIIYCRSIRKCSELYAPCEEHLGKNPVDMDIRQFDMVHSITMPDVNTSIVDRFMRSTALLVVVFATKILWMGIDIRRSQVVHDGPPGTVDDYLQQIGRAGRDGQQAHAVLLFHGKHLRNLDGALRCVVRNLDNCIREILLEGFPGETQPINDKHLCRNICASKCNCAQCSVYESMYECFVREHEEQEEADSGDEEEEYRQLLEGREHRLLTSSEHPLHAAPSLLHGLDNSVIEEFLEKAAEICSVDDDNDDIA